MADDAEEGQQNAEDRRLGWRALHGGLNVEPIQAGGPNAEPVQAVPLVHVGNFKERDPSRQPFDTITMPLN
jgi:hypothetical protein